MEWLNFHHLRYFWVVAKKGGVRKAAEELHVSQPSISAQLKLLEQSLEVPLFRRSGRHLVLSEMGHLVLSYADEIFSAGRELMTAVKQRPGKLGVKMPRGASASRGKFPLSSTAARANRRLWRSMPSNCPRFSVRPPATTRFSRSR